MNVLTGCSKTLAATLFKRVGKGRIESNKQTNKNKTYFKPNCSRKDELKLNVSTAVVNLAAMDDAILEIHHRHMYEAALNS